MAVFGRFWAILGINYSFGDILLFIAESLDGVFVGGFEGGSGAGEKGDEDDEKDDGEDAGGGKLEEVEGGKDFEEAALGVDGEVGGVAD